ncbi:type II-A CRISPR-associated protein Csn2 (plasmid) [Nicoliella spurrieriana]|uniref:Type II-A CRISPR-associated protein Csn2 n=1 Tax=Nicoliella spurrieriana TaxID=2925830 RepID=A0A976RQH7_9LACO|nr:type II-A CRISPR-associated protein Csn2 [Nicoliella spurrieriana]UQS85968.1 type II-A CRISPR-associated protein Csn2 [Nicoliella spurrieriana]
MIFTYHAHEHIKLNPGKITVISTNNQSVYYDLLTGIDSDSGKVTILDDHYDALKISKIINWVGDINNYSISKPIESVYKHIAENLNEQQINSIHNLTTKLFTEVQGCLFMANLPLTVNNDGDISKVFKYCGIRLEPSIKNNPYDIIETLINIQVELNDIKIIGLTNVAHYLTSDHFQELASLCRNADTSLLCIEFASLSDSSHYPDCDFYNIDSDFVDWHN